MTITTRRRVGATVLAAACAATLAAAPASADRAEPKKPQGNPNLTTVQLLSFNDYHGHLEATDPKLTPTEDPSQTPVGGAEHLSTTLSTLRAKAGKGSSLTVAAGDLIVGWLLLRQAEVAQAALDGGATGRDADFYTGKVAAASFYAKNVLPKIAAERAIAEATDNDLMDVPESAF